MGSLNRVPASVGVKAGMSPLLDHPIWQQRQPSVNGDWLSQWERAISDPLQNRHPLTDLKKMSQVTTSATPTAVPNLVHIRPWGVSGRMVTYNLIFFIYTLFSGTQLQVRRVDGFSHDSNDVDSRKDVPFWISLTLLPI